MKHSKGILTLLFAATFSALPLCDALGAIIYDNGAPMPDRLVIGDGFGEYGGDIKGVVGGSRTTLSTTTTDDFILSGPASVEGMGLFVNDVTGWNGHLDYAFRAAVDVLGRTEPRAILATGSAQHVVSSLSSYPYCCSGANAWLITFDFESPFAASGATPYWLELGGAGAPGPMYWVPTGIGNARALWDDRVLFAWNQGSSFYLTGSTGTEVREPSVLALLGLGLAGVAFVRRPRRPSATPR